MHVKCMKSVKSIKNNLFRYQYHHTKDKFSRTDLLEEVDSLEEVDLLEEVDS